MNAPSRSPGSLGEVQEVTNQTRQFFENERPRRHQLKQVDGGGPAECPRLRTRTCTGQEVRKTLSDSTFSLDWNRVGGRGVLGVGGGQARAVSRPPLGQFPNRSREGTHHPVSQTSRPFPLPTSTGWRVFLLLWTLRPSTSPEGGAGRAATLRPDSVEP